MIKRNVKFESDMRDAIYNAIAKVCFKWNNPDLSEEQITAAVDRAVDWWSDHFFEEYEGDEF